MAFQRSGITKLAAIGPAPVVALRLIDRLLLFCDAPADPLAQAARRSGAHRGGRYGWMTSFGSAVAVVPSWRTTTMP